MAGEIFVSDGFSLKDWKESNTSWSLPLLAAENEAFSEQSALQEDFILYQSWRYIGLLDMWMPFNSKTN